MANNGNALDILKCDSLVSLWSVAVKPVEGFATTTAVKYCPVWSRKAIEPAVGVGDIFMFTQSHPPGADGQAQKVQKTIEQNQPGR